MGVGVALGGSVAVGGSAVGVGLTDEEQPARPMKTDRRRIERKSLMNVLSLKGRLYTAHGSDTEERGSSYHDPARGPVAIAPGCFARGRRAPSTTKERYK